MAITQGLHHLGLTVSNIDQTRDFFVNVLAFKQVGAKPDYPAYFVSDGTTLLTLWQAKDQSLRCPLIATRILVCITLRSKLMELPRSRLCMKNSKRSQTSPLNLPRNP